MRKNTKSVKPNISSLKNALFLLNPLHMSENQQQQLVIPVVFLGNTYQQQHLLIDIPKQRNQVTHVPEQIESLDEEDQKLLQEFNIQQVIPDFSGDITIPAFMTSEMTDLTHKALLLDNQEERRLKLYSILQTAPQLFQAINQELNDEFKISEDCDFLGLNTVNIYDEEKNIQLSPYFLKQHTPEMKQQFYSGFEFEELFENEDEYNQIAEVLGTFKPLKNDQDEQYDVFTPYFQETEYTDEPITFNFTLPPGQSAQHFNCLVDMEKVYQNLLNPNNKGTFTEKFVDITRRKMLSTISQKYKGLYLSELQKITEDAKTSPISDLAITMLYFDKLDILYTYQLLQQIIGFYPLSAPVPPLLIRLRNNTFGWPVTLQGTDQLVPVGQIQSNGSSGQNAAKQAQAFVNVSTQLAITTIANITSKVEDLYQQLQQTGRATNNINEIYNRIFKPSLKANREDREAIGIKSAPIEIKITQVGKIIPSSSLQANQYGAQGDQIELNVTESQRHYTIVVPKVEFDAAGGNRLLNISMRPIGTQNQPLPNPVAMGKLYDIIKNQINLIKQSKAKLSKPKIAGNYSGSSVIGAQPVNLPQIPQNISLLAEKTQRRWKRNVVKPTLSKLKITDQSDLLTQKFIYAGKLNTMTIFDLDEFFSICIALARQDLQLPAFQYDEFQGKTGYGSQTSLICPPQRIYCALLRYMFGNYDFMENNTALSSLIYIYKNIFMTDKQVLKDSLQPYMIIDALDQDETQEKTSTPILKESPSNTSISKRQKSRQKMQSISSMGSDQLERYQEIFVLPQLNMSRFDFKEIIADKQTLGDFITEVVDRSNIFSINKNNLQLLYQNSNLSDDKYFQLNPEQEIQALLIQNQEESKENDTESTDQQDILLTKALDIFKGKQFDPQIYDDKNKKFKPGYILLLDKNLFSEATDDPQSFTYITKISSFAFDCKERIDECFYRFQNYGVFYNERLANYCATVLQAIEMFVNSTTNMINTQRKNVIDDVFSDYYNCRLDALDVTNLSTQNQLTSDYWEKHKIATKVLERAHTTPKNVQLIHIQRLESNYEYLSLVTDIFNNSMQYLDFKVKPSNWRTINNLSSFWGIHSISQTGLQNIYYQLRSPEAVSEAVKELVVEKEEFHYPIVEDIDPEPEVDISALKKDQILSKLRTHGGSYKQVPEDMYKRFKEQHGELFELGIYERDQYHVPTSFQETRQLANSVLNYQYFTIPFGSEAGKHMDVNVDFKQEDDITDFGAARYKHQANSIKSQYIKWIGPTGAEAQVCHIEEEQLCFSIYRVRANCLMKILIEWMAIYTPGLIKFFDCTLTTTQMDTSVDIYRMYEYRIKVDEFFQSKYNQKPVQYLYNSDYKYAMDKLEFDRDESEEDSDSDQMEEEGSQIYHAFSDDFDKAVIDYISLYQHYANNASTDPFIMIGKVNQIQDNWSKGCYSPIQQWPFQVTEDKIQNENASEVNSRDVFPPAPSIPYVLQQFITQMYTTGDILDEMFKCPVAVIPIIARSVQQQIAMSKHGEQRAAGVWRNIYPDAYYRSIDHAHICLQAYDKKLLQPKYIMQDMQRRLIDTDMGLNPQILDSSIDFCLPKCFDLVNFWKYTQGLKIDKKLEQQLILNYSYRQQIQQRFIPFSNLIIPFKATAGQLSGEIFRLMQQHKIPPAQRDAQFHIFKRILQNISGIELQQFSQEHFKNILKLEEHDEVYDQLMEVQPGSIVSLFMQSEDIELFTQLCFEKYQGKLTSKSLSVQIAPKIDISRAIFMEHILRDVLSYQPQHQIDKRQSTVYSQEAINFIVNCCSMLRHDHDGHATLCKQNAERMISDCAILPAVFEGVQSDVWTPQKLASSEINESQDTQEPDNRFVSSLNNQLHNSTNQQQEKQQSLTYKSFQSVYTESRTISMPTATLRAALTLRAMILNEQYDQDFIKKLFIGQITFADFRKRQNEILDAQRRKMYNLVRRLANSDKAQTRQQIQQQLQAFQYETARKLILDQYLIPVMIGLQDEQNQGTQSSSNSTKNSKGGQSSLTGTVFNTKNESYIRYADSELYITMRMCLIFCYRLEYCFRVLECASPEQRQTAVYGTRSMQAIPLSLYNQQVLGTSTFGNPLEEFYEQLTSKTASKGHAESFPLLVSYRVFNGHQPSAQYNNSDASINDCRCQAVTCAFCGGIGSSYNGTLSGNINSRAAGGGYAQMDVDLVNGSCLDGIGMGRRCYDFSHDELSLKPKLHTTDSTSGTDSILGLYWQPQRMSLYRRLQPAIPHASSENPMVGPVQNTTIGRRNRPTSTENSESHENQILGDKLNQLLSKLQSRRKQKEKNEAKADDHKHANDQNQDRSYSEYYASSESSEEEAEVQRKTNKKKQQANKTNKKGNNSSNASQSQNSPKSDEKQKMQFESMYFGQRLSDTTLNLPPPDVYTQIYYQNQMTLGVDESINAQTPQLSSQSQKHGDKKSIKQKSDRQIEQNQNEDKQKKEKSAEVSNSLQSATTQGQDQPKKQNLFVKEYLQNGHYKGIIGKPFNPNIMWTQDELFDTDDQILFDDPFNSLLLDKYGDILKRYQSLTKFQDFIYAGIELDERYAGNQYSNIDEELGQLYDILNLFSALVANTGAKDEYIQDRAYALLGTHAYPLVSLKRLLPVLHKRLDSTTNRALAVHFDVIQPCYFKSSKAQPQTNLTTSILIYCIQQNILGNNIASFQLTQYILNQIYEATDGFYVIETVKDFINLQQVSGKQNRGNE